MAPRLTKKELFMFPAMVIAFLSIAVALFGTRPWATIQGYFADPYSTPKCSSELRARQSALPGSISSSTATAKSVPVLLYHGVALDSARSEDILFCDFKDHMLTLKANGYQTITLHDFYLFTQGKIQLPDKSFLLTFDDGQKTSYYLTDALLKQLDYSAVMFIITKHSLREGSGYYLSFQEVQMLLESGRWEIQSHGKDAHQYIDTDDHGGRGHYLSNKLWLKRANRLETDNEYLERIRNDFIESKTSIEEQLGIDVIAYAFPFGDFGQGSTNLPAALDYIRQEIASVYELGNFFQVYPSTGYTFNYADPTSFMIRRIKVTTTDSGDALLQVLQRGRDKALPFNDTFETEQGWIPIWGQMIRGEGMLFKSNPGSPGSAAFLDGTYLWSNYKFTARVKSAVGGNIELIGRYADKSNFVGCNFNNNSVRIDQRIDEHVETLDWRRLETPLGSTDLNVALEVSGTNVNCLVNGAVLISTTDLSPTLNIGGIGIRSFDSDTNNTQVQVAGVSVESLN